MQVNKLNKTLGVIGAGQLGKMIGLAAANLGINCYFYDPDKNAPAKNISKLFYNYSFNNEKRLIEFAKKCDFITYEFENIPINTLQKISKYKKIYPSIKALQVSQDRFIEKNFIKSLGVKVADFVNIESFSDIKENLKDSFKKGILKTRRLGYDGKGQTLLELKSLDNLKLKIRPNAYILEKYVPFKKEISVIAIREKSGKIKTFEPTQNIHKAGILRETIYPANISKKCILKAKNIAKKITKELNITGLLAIEMFILNDENILVNEIAPRPHNSGHWTTDACNISQFDALVRSIFSIPIPQITYTKNCKMINLLGDNFYSYKKHLNKKNSQVYIYGKTSVKPSRKMGHINIII